MESRETYIKKLVTISLTRVPERTTGELRQLLRNKKYYEKNSKYFKEYYVKYNAKKSNKVKNCSRRKARVNQLPDDYLAGLLETPVAELRKYPELIELKRQSLLLKREIKTFKN